MLGSCDISNDGYFDVNHCLKSVQADLGNKFRAVNETKNPEKQDEEWLKLCMFLTSTPIESTDKSFRLQPINEKNNKTPAWLTFDFQREAGPLAGFGAHGYFDKDTAGGPLTQTILNSTEWKFNTHKISLCHSTYFFTSPPGTVFGRSLPLSGECRPGDKTLIACGTLPDNGYNLIAAANPATDYLIIEHLHTGGRSRDGRWREQYELAEDEEEICQVANAAQGLDEWHVKKFIPFEIQGSAGAGSDVVDVAAWDVGDAAWDDDPDHPKDDAVWDDPEHTDQEEEVATDDPGHPELGETRAAN